MAADMEDNLEYFLLTNDDFDEIYALFEEQFLRRNPICIAAKETESACYGELFVKDIKDGLTSGISLGVRDKKTKKIVGARLTAVVKFGEEDTKFGEKMTKDCVVFQILGMFGPDEKVFDGFPSFLKMVALTVHHDYSGRGIARKLVEKTLKLGSERGYKAAGVQVTNSRTARLFAHLGFEVVKTLDLSTVADELGLDLSLIPQNETLVQLMVKRGNIEKQ